MIYWGEDGVVDLVLGLNMFLVGMLFLIGNIWVAQAGWLSCSLGMRWGIKTLKERVTMARGGYVELRNPQITIRSTKWPLWGLVAGVFALIGFIATELRTGMVGRERFAVPMVSIVFALALGIPGWMYRLPHMIWLGGFSLVLGAFVYQLHRGFGESLCGMMIGLGMAMAISGALRLRKFLKENPAA